jgi:hypothetical protein
MSTVITTESAIQIIYTVERDIDTVVARGFDGRIHTKCGADSREITYELYWNEPG